MHGLAASGFDHKGFRYTMLGAFCTHTDTHMHAHTHTNTHTHGALNHLMLRDVIVQCLPHHYTGDVSPTPGSTREVVASCVGTGECTEEHNPHRHKRQKHHASKTIHECSGNAHTQTVCAPPPPRIKVGRSQPSTCWTHSPTARAVRLKESIGSPTRVSAPHCSTTTSGAHALRTRERTLRWQQ